jgi:hypothetical protein
MFSDVMILSACFNMPDCSLSSEDGINRIREFYGNLSDGDSEENIDAVTVINKYPVSFC